jgi:hypothetical protein
MLQLRISARREIGLALGLAHLPRVGRTQALMIAEGGESPV